MKKNTIIFALAFVVLIALGIIFNSGIRNEKVKIAEKKFNEDIFTLLPGTDADKLEEVEVPDSDKETKLVRKFKVFKDTELVGYVYVGETKGYKAGLQIAYGINVKNHKVTGAKIVASNETDRFLAALANSNFYEQFKNIDLTVFDITLKRLLLQDTTSSATPNGNNTSPDSIVGVDTTKGFENLLLFIREEYAKDNNKFVMPTGLALKTKALDYKNVDLFLYVFQDGDEEIKVTVDKNYEIKDISDQNKWDEINELLKESKNKINNYIVSAITEGTVTTLVIRANTYYRGDIGTQTYATTTVTIDNGTVTNVSLVYSHEQTFDDEHNSDYNGGDLSEGTISGLIKNDVTIEVITGASRTSEGVIATQTILRNYLEANYE